MNILVTIGTTPFETLIRCVDQTVSGHELRFQIASGKYHPQNGSWFRFGDIDEHYSWADLIITHAGAGSVYTLLELGKKLIVIPNLERRDPHQQELARYVEKLRVAMVIWTPEAINSAIEASKDFIFEPYVPYDFFRGSEITSILLSKFPAPIHKKCN